MSAAAAVVDFEVTGKLSESALPSSPSAVVLFRLHGRPLGWGAAHVTDGHLDSAALTRRFIHEHAWTCALPLAERAIQSGRPPLMPEATALLQSPPPTVSTGPLVTVAVRSRTPANRLGPCLDSLMRLAYLSLDLVLIDASNDRHVEALVRERYPQIRYRRAAGSGMPSRQAIEECRGDILAVTDGESVVDRQWVSALVHVFLADPEVMTVGGLGVPHSLRQPFRPALPAGAPFCRSWWHVREDDESSDGAIQQTLERASSNIAYWCPLRATPSRYTRVWEPAAIVRTPAAIPMPGPASTRGHVRTLDRNVDLRDGVVPISDACDYDSLRLHVTWSGEPVGVARLAHHGAVVSRLWIQDAIAQQLTAPVLDAGLRLGPDVARALLTADLVRYMVSRWKPAAPRSSTPAAARTAAA